MTTRPSQILYLSSLTQVSSRSRTNPNLSILVYDSVLEKKFAREIEAFPHRFSVESGEPLKSVESFASFCEQVSRASLELPARQMTVVAMGGGSVGDFAGFFASVYKRGVRLVHVPSTWLAAIDSAHGGKTALNVGGAKNQIGTFYPADCVCLVRSLLESSGPERVEDAMGELAKIALIDGGAWVRKLETTRLHGTELMWKFLKLAVDSKLKVVRRDPREEKGIRQLLNLGHTLGHVIEAEQGLSHGASVAQGLFFALEYSRHRKFLKDAAFERAMSLMGVLGLAPHPRPLTASDLRRSLMADKKRDRAGEVTFIFLKGFGRAERRAVKVDDLIVEARRQGWAE
jgi:3-dehydroquinate synthase